MSLIAEHAVDWARLAREVVQTPYPYASGHVATGPDDTDVTPQRLHPAFWGCLDWHSSVHMQWSLLTLSARCPELLGPAGELSAGAALLSGRLTPAHLAVEATYLRQRPGFERPYGWAWVAALAAAAQGSAHERALRPLVEVVADHLLAWLPRHDQPVRHGKHQNDAFALRLLIPAMVTLGRDDVVALARSRASDWFAADAAADTRAEPSGSDFLSPALTEAELMRLVLPADQFGSWLAAYLPGLGEGAHEHLLEVPRVSDRQDGQAVHLVGLGLSRAWQLRSLAPQLSEPAAVRVRAAAAAMVQAALPEITAGHFMATHWLVSFALLAEGAGDEHADQERR